MEMKGRGVCLSMCGPKKHMKKTHTHTHTEIHTYTERYIHTHIKHTHACYLMGREFRDGVIPLLPLALPRGVLRGHAQPQGDVLPCCCIGDVGGWVGWGWT